MGDVESTISIMHTVQQYGFAGLCTLQLGVIVWCIKKILSVVEENTKAITELTGRLAGQGKLLKDIEQRQEVMSDRQLEHFSQGHNK